MNQKKKRSISRKEGEKEKKKGEGERRDKREEKGEIMKFLTSQTWGFVGDLFFLLLLINLSEVEERGFSGFAVTGFGGMRVFSSRKRAPTPDPLVFFFFFFAFEDSTALLFFLKEGSKWSSSPKRKGSSCCQP